MPLDTVNKKDPREWPFCAACARPCDAMVCFKTSSGVYWRATCHGSTVQAFVSHRALMKCHGAGDSIVWNIAFHPGGEPLVMPLRGKFRSAKRGTIKAPMVGHPKDFN